MNDANSHILEQGIAHHRAGRFAPAEQLYRQALTADPHNAKALHLLGLLAHQNGHQPQGLALVESALALQPDRPDFLNSRGMILAALDRRDEAAQAYRRAIELKPGYAPALNNLGIVLQAIGRNDQAQASFIAAFESQPQFVEAMCNLAGLYVETSRFADAIALCHRALRGRPGDAKALNLLGRSCYRAGQYAEAASAFESQLAARPGDADAHFHLALVRAAQNDLPGAVARYQRVLSIDPRRADALSNLGSIYLDLNRTADAIDALERSLAIKSSAGTHCNLGLAYGSAQRIDSAIAQQRSAVELDPTLVQSWANLAGSLREAGDIDGAMDAGRQGAVHGCDALMQSNLVYASHFHPRYSARDILNEHLRWAAQHASDISPRIEFSNDRNPDRPLRVGFVSPDLRQHVVGWNLLPFLRHHDAEQFEVYCYSDAVHPDDTSSLIRSFSKQWRDTSRLSNAQLERQILEDRIDVLVDLTLHMANNRLLVFAARPAPVQLTYLGYCSTTGLRQIDYRLSDHQLDPSETDLSCYTEKTFHLPQSYWCYEAPVVANEIPPTVRKPGLTFGCLNSYAKVSIDSLNLWGQLLARVPGSRLLVQASPGSPRQRALDALGALNIDPARIEFVGKQGWAAYLATYQRIDVSLDPFPYGGGITTCDSLYMGTPVVTLSGRTAVGRGGRTVLHNIQLSDWCAATPQDYVRVAAELIQNPERLQHFRQTLRQRMLDSPLMDQQRFTHDIQTALRQMWLNYLYSR